VRLLLENNADITARNKRGQTALDEAARENHGAVASLLRPGAADATQQQAPVGQHTAAASQVFLCGIPVLQSGLPTWLSKCWRSCAG